MDDFNALVGSIVLATAVDVLIAQILVWGFQANHIYPNLTGVWMLVTGVSLVLLTSIKRR